jgi:hypothetical protein
MLKINSYPQCSSLFNPHLYFSAKPIAILFNKPAKNPLVIKLKIHIVGDKQIHNRQKMSKLRKKHEIPEMTRSTLSIYIFHFLSCHQLELQKKINMEQLKNPFE